MSAIPVNEITARHFADLNHALVVHTSLGDCALSVIRAIERPQHVERSVPPCTLELRGPATPLLPQSTYNVSHAVIGTHDLFIVPLSQNASECRYEIIFN